jgi:hypothetical protein
MKQPMNLKEHWNHVYQTEEHDNVSWYQSRPATSLQLIEACGVGKQECIIDVGGGASVLVDFLLDAGFNGWRCWTSRRLRSHMPRNA